MALLVLLGNTSVKVESARGCFASFPLPGNAETLRSALKGAADRDVAAASVNPAVEPLLDAACRLEGLSAPVYAGRDFPAGVPMAVGNPASVGIDRVLNVKAAFARCRRALATVDFGTATSVSVADGEGRFVGGAIMPGVGLALRALRENTALLPEVATAFPVSALGKNTVEAMTSGCVFGAAGAAKEVVARIEAAMGTRLEVFVTGGDAAVMAEILPATWTLSQGLTLEGLRLAYDETK